MASPFTYARARIRVALHAALIGLSLLIAVGVQTSLAQPVDPTRQRLSAFNAGPLLTLDLSQTPFSGLVALGASGSGTSYEVTYGFPGDFPTVTLRGDSRLRPSSNLPACPPASQEYCSRGTATVHLPIRGADGTVVRIGCCADPRWLITWREPNSAVTYALEVYDVVLRSAGVPITTSDPGAAARSVASLADDLVGGTPLVVAPSNDEDRNCSLADQLPIALLVHTDSPFYEGPGNVYGVAPRPDLSDGIIVQCNPDSSGYLATLANSAWGGASTQRAARYVGEWLSENGADPASEPLTIVAICPDRPDGRLVTLSACFPGQ